MKSNPDVTISASFFSQTVIHVTLVATYLLAGVCQVRAQAVITTFAGTGVPAFSGDQGPAISAALNNPSGLATDAAGNIYIGDSGNYRVRRVDRAGIITTVAGNGSIGNFGDGGEATHASFSSLFDVVVDSSGNLYIADAGNHRVRKVSPAGIVTALAGTGVQGNSGDEGQAANATLNRPIGLALDPFGNLFISDSSNHNIRRVNLSTRVITTYAGSGTPGFSGDLGPATSAQLQFPLGIATDPSGDLFIADAGNSAIRRVSPSGTIDTVAGVAGHAGFVGDGGPASAALLNLPSGLALDSAGRLFIADSGNNRVRRVDPTGTIITVAGGSSDGFSRDGGSATTALLSFPFGLTIDAEDSLYIADRANQRVRRTTTPGGRWIRGRPRRFIR